MQSLLQLYYQFAEHWHQESLGDVIKSAATKLDFFDEIQLS